MALWYNSFYESLLYNNVQVTRFYFDHHPDVLFNEKYKTGIEFREIMHRFSHAMLFVFADGMQFVNPVTQKLYAWVGELAVFPHRILFSSVSVGFWGKREQLLQHIFQMIVPFTRNGLMAINEWISGNSSSEIFNIPYWQNQVEQNFSAIDTTDIDMRELEIYYNTPMRRWIAACAIYPELNWNLTLALGQLLSSEKNPLHTYSHLAQLIQLDWFANGYIPDKYRLLLITQWLTKEDITRIHEFLYNQLSRIKPLEEEAEYEAYALQLAIHELLSRKTKTDFENTFAALTPKVEKKIRIRDLVNIYLINQHKLSPVEFEIPEKWLQKMGLAQYVSTDTPSFSSYTETATGVPFDMVAVKGGTFKIGSGADAGDETSPPYDISVPDFYMGKTEVTVAEFKTFVDATGYISEAENNIGFKGSRMWTSSKWEDKEGVYWRCDVNGKIRNTSEYNHPVIHVSWNDAKAYCEWLSTKTGKTYRLPSEAEWEYAAGASTGSATNASSGSAIANETLTGSGTLSGLRNKWAGTNDENLLHEYAWYSKNSGGTTQPAATRKANPLGLYDMSGNVWEWCEDDWHDKYDGIPRDGKAWVDATRGSSRLLRGGSWDDDADDCRVAYRDNVSPSYRSNYVGFRLSRNL